MKKEKNTIYYRGLLHKDTIVLLIVAVLFAIANIFFIANRTEEAVPVFLKSILFIIFYIILLCNKKENAPFVGILAIVTGGLMIITSLGDGSLFGVVYFLLGVFYIIHSIVYLVKLKKEPNISEQPVQMKSKITYINLGLIILSIICFLASVFFLGENIEILFIILTFVSLLFVFISSIVLMIKKYKGALLYITFVISMTFGLLSMIMLTFRLSSIFEDFKYKNSNEYIIDMLEDLEDALEDDVSNLSFEGFLLQPLKNRGSYVLIDKKHYEEAIPLWNEKRYNKMTSAYKNEQLNGITCDGYVEVRPNYESYDECLITFDNRDSACEYRLRDYETEAYLNCNGDYTYTTEGFDENKLNESKTDEYYKINSIKALENLFGNDVVYYAPLLYSKPTESSPTPVFVSKKEYEELTNKFNYQNIFANKELKGITCDGYVKLELDQNKELSGKAYISCSGDYTYTTEGFDNTKLSN